MAFATLWNVLGRAAPQLVALITAPLMINALGPSRWGIFSLAMALLGVSTVLDLGIGRALTRGVTHRLHAGQDEQAAALVKTGLVLLGIVGSLAGMAVAAAAHPLAYRVIGVPANLRHETELALYVIALTIPLVILNGALWGVIAALDLFRTANLVALCIVAASYVGQLLVFYVFRSLAAVMLVLLASRIVFQFVYWKLCHDAMPSLGTGRFNRADIGPMMRLGGWMTVSNIVFPLLSYADRFMIATVLSAAAVGYYATPGDLMGRVHIITGATLVSLFPAIAASYRMDPGRAAALFGRSIVTVCVVLFPVALFVGVFSNEFLTLWISADYASHAAPVLRIFAIGTLLGAADGIVATLLDAIGLPSVNAKLSVCQLVVYIPVLFLALHLFGFVGGAVTSVARAALDFHIRLWLARKLYPAIATVSRGAALTALTGTMLLPVPMACTGLAARCAAAGFVTVLYVSIVYARAATPRERLHIRSRMAALVAIALPR